MPLVNYSDSSSSGDEEAGQQRLGSPSGKRKLGAHTGGELSSLSPTAKLPPLPSKFHDLYASSSRLSNHDDPSLHGGRKRAIPHVEGNWPTHVYLEFTRGGHPTLSESTHLLSLVAKISSSHPEVRLQSLLTSDLGAPLPLHISLSGPIVLVTHERGPFLELLTESVRHSGVRPFEVSFSSLDWAPNENRTRFFLVLRLAKANLSTQPQSTTSSLTSRSPNPLNRLLHFSNAAAERFGQPPLYAEPQKDIQPPHDRARGRSSRNRYRGRGRSSRGRGRGRGSLPTGGSSMDDRVSKSHAVYLEQFHVSIGWSLQEPPAEVVAFSTSLAEREEDNPSTVEGFQGWKVRFESVKVKIGNAVTNMDLPTKVEEGKGVIGL
ncbi:MAG: poly(U)-specific 3'-to-5' RNA exonuclease [Sclerophora amabilis]|nr:MAG: poly(U)-specific 3'-to-5' RNA exonuclease [Sclerophora amabilis]